MPHRTMFYGGPIITCNLRDEVEEALVIEDQKILYAGPKSRARCLTDADTAFVDLEGGALLPGFFCGMLDFWQGGIDRRPLAPVFSDAGAMTEVLRRAAVHARKRESSLLSAGVTAFCEAGESGAQGLRALQLTAPDLSATVLLCGEGDGDVPARLVSCGVTGGFGDERVRIVAVRIPVTIDNAGCAARRETWCLRVRSCLGAFLGVQYEPKDPNTLLTCVRAHTAFLRDYPAAAAGRLLLTFPVDARTCDEITQARLRVVVSRRLLRERAGECGFLAQLTKNGASVSFAEDETSVSPLCGVADAASVLSGARPLVDSSVLAALRFATLGGALCASAVEDAGSLEWGKRADLLRLSGDPLSVSAADLRRLGVTAVWRAGRSVSPAPQAHIPAQTSDLCAAV
ncbi:MAG: amidohydrolase family protein [Clostridia bacterium]|nr:amidohydrolase family protein [Clostridia bacterium]